MKIWVSAEIGASDETTLFTTTNFSTDLSSSTKSIFNFPFESLVITIPNGLIASELFTFLLLEISFPFFNSTVIADQFIICVSFCVRKRTVTP